MKKLFNKKNKYFFPIIVSASVIFILLIVLLSFTVWRNSEAEIGSLKISEKVDKYNRSISPSITISSKAESIYVSGRLAHVRNSKAKVEFMDAEGDFNNFGYPKTLDLKVSMYPNNYFAFKLDENSCKTCTGSGWRVGKYKVKVYPENDPNPQKPEVEFEIIK